MRNREIPYTSDDLRYIADQIDKVSDDIGNVADIPDGDWRWGLTVEMTDDGGETVGHLRAYGDGWIGYFPLAVS